MNLVKQDIGVWVKASDELPYFEKKVYLKDINFDSVMAGNFFTDANEVVSLHISSTDTHPGFVIKRQHFNAIFWLKSIPQVYVLTEYELDMVIREFGYLTTSSGDNVETDAENFIQSLTK